MSPLKYKAARFFVFVWVSPWRLSVNRFLYALKLRSTSTDPTGNHMYSFAARAKVGNRRPYPFQKPATLTCPASSMSMSSAAAGEHAKSRYAYHSSRTAGVTSISSTSAKASKFLVSPGTLRGSNTRAYLYMLLHGCWSQCFDNLDRAHVDVVEAF